MIEQGGISGFLAFLNLAERISRFFARRFSGRKPIRIRRDRGRRCGPATRFLGRRNVPPSAIYEVSKKNLPALACTRFFGQRRRFSGLAETLTDAARL